MIKNKVIKTIISVETNANFNLKKKRNKLWRKGGRKKRGKRKRSLKAPALPLA